MLDQWSQTQFTWGDGWRQFLVVVGPDMGFHRSRAKHPQISLLTALIILPEHEVATEVWKLQNLRLVLLSQVLMWDTDMWWPRDPWEAQFSCRLLLCYTLYPYVGCKILLLGLQV